MITKFGGSGKLEVLLCGIIDALCKDIGEQKKLSSATRRFRSGGVIDLDFG